MKKDIFNGKIKKEYFSYILAYMIFFIVLFMGIGALCIYASIWGMTTKTSGERLLITSFGVIAFLLVGVYAFLEMLVIRRFPKYKKIRRVLFNSDIYFTDSTSDEYFGGSRTICEQRNNAAFDLVTAFAELEKGMGKKKPIRYTVYGAMSIVMSVIGLVALIVMPFLFDKGIIFPNMSDEIFVFLFILLDLVCIALAIFFLFNALKAGITAQFENHKWTYELYSALVDISVLQNRKKNKFWYDRDQAEQIESLVKSLSENAELKLETRGNKIVSFRVVDTMNNSVRFTGLFT